MPNSAESAKNHFKNRGVFRMQKMGKKREGLSGRFLSLEWSERLGCATSAFTSLLAFVSLLHALRGF